MEKQKKKAAKVYRFPTAEAVAIQPSEPLSHLEEAFDWVVKEMGDYNATDVRFHDLEGLSANYDNHVSIFHRPGWQTAILRIYWPLRKLVIYHTIMNFPEMEANSPELTRYFLRNGEYAYLSATDSEMCLQVYGSY